LPGTHTMHPDGGPHILMRCLDQGAILAAQQETMAADRETMQAARDAYLAALTAATSDDAALAQAQQEIIRLKQQHTEARFALESSIVALLSTEQAAQLGQCLINMPAGPWPTGGHSAH